MHPKVTTLTQTRSDTGTRHAHAHRCTRRGTHARTRTPARPGRGSFRENVPACRLRPRTSCPSLLPAPTWLRAGQPERERGTSLSTSVPSCAPRPGLPSPPFSSLSPHLLLSFSPSFLWAPFFFLPLSSFSSFLAPSFLSLFPYLAFLLPSPSLQPSLSFPSFPLIRLLSRAPAEFIMHPVQIDHNVLWYPGEPRFLLAAAPPA